MQQCARFYGEDYNPWGGRDGGAVRCISRIGYRLDAFCSGVREAVRPRDIEPARFSSRLGDGAAPYGTVACAEENPSAKAGTGWMQVSLLRCTSALHQYDSERGYPSSIGIVVEGTKAFVV